LAGGNVLDVDSNFIDTEDIVSKLHLIEHIERSSPYPQSGGRPYFERVKDSLKNIPLEHQKYALALFANAIYLPDPLLRDTWEYLLNEAARFIGADTMNDVITGSMFFELDVSGELYKFINKNKIRGRLDRDLFPRTQNVEQLLEKMLLLASSDDDEIIKGPKEEISVILAKKYWVLLIDNSLSGTSLCSELERLARLAEILDTKASVEKVLLLVQVLTEDAKKKIEEAIRSVSVNVELIYSLYFEDGFKVGPDKISSCKLFASSDTVEGVIRLCQWFGQQEFFTTDERYATTKRISADDLAFGFKGGGWTIVTPNCPTNSIPLLWYSNPAHYKGPFVRVDSRVSQTKGQGQERLDLLIKRKESFLRKL
jgi:hypothetical protein